MKKSIFLFFAAILYATSALGIGAKQCYVYFDNSTWNATNVKFVFWQDKGSNKFYIDTESMTTLSNTQLKYVRTTDHSSWNPAIAAFNFLEVANTGDWGDQELTWSNFQSWAQTKYTAKQSDWDFNGGYQLFTGAQTEKNKSVSGTYNSGYANLLQKTHTLKVMVSTDGGTTYAQATTSPAEVTFTTYTMSSATATTSKTYTIAKDATTTSNSSVKAIYTAKTTLKAENIADGYTFAGWYDATNGTMISTSATPSAWYPKEAITLEARFNKEQAHPVTISYMCGSEEIESPATETVGVTTPSTITAATIPFYTFSGWTLGSGVQAVDANANPIQITTKAEGDYTLTANYTAIPTETVYLVNNSDWTKVYAYGWKNGEAQGTPAWPGAEITANKLAEKYEGYDVYSYKVKEGSYDNVIFNNGSGKQTATFDWENGKYYYAVDPLSSNVFLAGEMNEWNGSADELKKETKESTTASVTINLTAKSYTFQLVIDGDWYGNTGTMKRGGDAVHEGGWSFEDTSYGANCTIVADFAGDYTFTWDLTTKKLTVAYPELPTYTVTANAENGTVTGAGEYKHGTEATLVATPNAGYAFVNWKNGEEVVSSEASYTFTVTANTDLVATFAPEETHEVTVSYICNSNPIPGHAAHTLAVGVTTPSTITAPAITNYTFDGWTLGSGVQAVDENANPIQITTKAEGEYTLTANYTKIELTYTVTVPKGTEKCYIAGDMNSWSFQEMTPTANANEFTVTIDGATTDHKYKYTCGEDWKYVEVKADGSNLDDDRKYAANDVVARWNCAPGIHLVGEMNNWNTAANKFVESGTTATVTIALEAGVYKFKVNNDGEWLGNNGTMTRGGDGMDTGWAFASDKDACQLTADITGDYTFTWNLETKKLTVTYPALPKHQVTATVNPAETGEVTGTGEYEQGSEATLIATPAAGYAFKNWTVGGIEKSSEATYTFTVSEAISLVANFIPEVTHEVTVSYICNSNPIPGHDATTLAVGVTTPSTITAPAITHYTFDSWTVGTGVQAVDATANPIQITTLAEGEYTLVANYTKIELTYTVKVPEGTEKCYIAGDMNSWSFQEMTPTANANEFTITIDGATTDHKYKYTCGEGWAYVEKKEDGSELDADRTYNANDVVAKWAEPAKCYLMGIGGDWTTGIEMEEDGDQFKLLCQPIAEGEQFKFKYGDTWTTDVENYDANGVDWVESSPGSGQYNITLPAGNYDFYYKKNENKVWIGVCTPATPTPEYTRTTTAGNFGTICLPFGSTNYTGMELFECVGQETGKVYLASVTTLEAGVPYIFLATGTELAVYSDGTTADEAGNHNGLHGTFDDNTVVEVGNYILKDNKLCQAATTCYVNANRAYLVMGDVPTGAPQQKPGRRYIGMSTKGENAATGLDNITNGENTTIKVIENGQLIIIRGGEKFNAQGQKL